MRQKWCHAGSWVQLPCVFLFSVGHLPGCHLNSDQPPGEGGIQESEMWLRAVTLHVEAIKYVKIGLGSNLPLNTDAEIQKGSEESSTEAQLCLPIAKQMVNILRHRAVRMLCYTAIAN